MHLLTSLHLKQCSPYNLAPFCYMYQMCNMSVDVREMYRLFSGECVFPHGDVGSVDWS